MRSGIDPKRKFLYVVETFARRISRFPLLNAGLGRGEVFAELGPGHYPDGIAFDVEGALWVTSIFSNRVSRISPDREIQRVLETRIRPSWRGSTRDYVSGRLAEAGHIDVPPRTAWQRVEPGLRRRPT
jgi:hypothetical protein